ncbi:MAG TPA: FtsX-like permease family protein [Bacteroidales bacterium]|nr:FtsX-like permease family protein [Bacteroidales bacterium]
MNLGFYIASRYVVSKKSHKIINIISLISAMGVMVGTMAMVIVLSVFNGFETLVKSLFHVFDPDLKIELAEGKTFSPDELPSDVIRNLPGVVRYTEVLEETVLLKYQQQQTLAVLKGVSSDFVLNEELNQRMIEGELVLEQGEVNHLVLGYGLAFVLGVNLNDALSPIVAYAPRRGLLPGPFPEQAFNSRSLFVSGFFSVQQDFDSRYSIAPLRFAQDLFDYQNRITSVEISLEPHTRTESIKEQISTLLGDRFKVRDRFEQQEMLYKIMRTEKLAIFLILSFIIILAAFNNIGTLSMIIIDKKQDISILQSMGANTPLIRKVFVTSGMMITLSGALLGMLAGAFVCWLQMQFGIIPLQAGGGSFVVDDYPVELQLLDFLYISTTVTVIGFVAAWLPSRKIKAGSIKPTK